MKKIGTTNSIEYEDLPQDDPKKRNPDISKAKNIIGWNPSVNLDDGLDKTIDYFHNLKEVEKK